MPLSTAIEPANRGPARQRPGGTRNNATPRTAAVQDWLPHIEEPARRSGIYPAQWYQGAIGRGEIVARREILPEQIQPASIDLRLGERAYRVAASFLPGPNARVADKLGPLTLEEIDLTEGAVLRRDSVYLVPLLESLDLKKRMSALANPKSSTGRLDVFARVITDQGSEFDTVAEQYEGPLWVEIAPRSFHIKVRTGSRLVQLRIKRGAPKPSARELRALMEEVGVVRGDGQEGETIPDIRRSGISVSIDLRGDPRSGLIGYRARKTDAVIDLDKVDHYPVEDFWEPLMQPESGGLVLRPDDFHILVSKEALSVPADYAADMIAYDTFVGEFRVHYAGFFDPGFGYGEDGPRGARAVLEVRCHDVPFLVEDGQIMCRLLFERLTEPSERPYGSGIGSNYQYQGLALAKHFKR